MGRVLGMVLMAAAFGCGPVPADEDPTGAVPAPPAPALTLPLSTDEQAVDSTWWAFAPDLPFTALRLSLVQGTEGEGRFQGSWMSFDWRGTLRQEELFRPSRPVAIAARLTGTRLVIQGPAPQLDASGYPNGQAGRWELRLDRTSLPGEALRFSGSILHADLAPGEGRPVELEKRFRAWKP